MKPLLILLTLLTPSLNAAGPLFQADSANHRTALLALYTSQGCSSCPPAERWLARLGASDQMLGKIVPIAFHVDYWDYIGWKDRYADPRYSERQRRIARSNHQRTVYTPQFVLNGEDLRPVSRLGERLPEIVGEPSSYHIHLSARFSEDRKLLVNWKTNPPLPPAHRMVLALTENGLIDSITSGENAGKTLSHEFVARELTQAAHSPVTITIGADVNPGKLALVAFIEGESGDVLQALRLDLSENSGSGG